MSLNDRLPGRTPPKFWRCRSPVPIVVQSISSFPWRLPRLATVWSNPILGVPLGLLSDLSERRFLQITGGFIAAGWIAMEAADQLVSHGMLPEVVYRILWVWYVAGIVASIVLGWFHGSRGRQAFTGAELTLLGSLLILTAAASGLVYHSARGERTVAEAGGELDLNTLAVLYFRSVGNQEQTGPIADGLTETLIEELSTVRGLEVVSRNGVEQFRGSDLPADSIAVILGAGTIIDGTVEDLEGRTRVSVALIDGSSGAEFGRLGFDEPSDRLLALQDALVWDLSIDLREWLGREVELRMLGRGTDVPRAWASLQRGRRAIREAQRLWADGDAETSRLVYSQAETALDQACALDPDWPEPIADLAGLAYLRSRQAETDEEAVRFIDIGLRWAEEALLLDPNHARAIELRGTITYWKWLLQVTSDPAERKSEYDSAKADLEAAVSLDPGRASAFSTLSHLYYGEDVASAVLAARRAYEEDAYLDVANEVLWRLFNGSLDLTQFDQAERWCLEGYRRFPTDYRFSLCELQLMATPALAPDVDRGWMILERMDSIVPEPWRGYQRAENRLFQGGVIARAGLPDSAIAVLSSAREGSGPADDPGQELLAVEAAMWVVAGDPDKAIALLRQYVAANPGHEFGSGGDLAWWWEDLRDHPDFRSLRGR